jgi:hypothetical protein
MLPMPVARNQAACEQAYAQARCIGRVRIRLRPGEIFRVGGTKPSGALFDALWQAVSK